jgi:hypothetical protein
VGDLVPFPTRSEFGDGCSVGAVLGTHCSAFPLVEVLP